MANIDDKNKNLEDSANIFGDDLFGTSSNDLFGSSDDLFGSSSQDLFGSSNNLFENINEQKNETLTQSDVKQESEEVNPQEENKEIESASENEQVEEQSEEDLDGYYAENGYYWFNNGTYYDNNGLYHDLDGNVIDEEGNVVETNVPVETPPQKQEEKIEESEPVVEDNSEENTEEVKKEKTVKTKNKKGKKKLKLIICGVILLLLLGGGAFFGISYYNKISVKLETPTLKIEKMSNKVILEATEVENAESYEFVVSIDDATPITLKSEKNKKELDVANYKKIVVKVRCLGKVKKANSDFSIEQTLSNKIKLKMNNVFVDGLTEIKDGQNVISYKTDDNVSDDIISWESVKNASKYYVYYKVDIDKDEVKKYEVEQTEGKIEFSLIKLYQENGAGYYNISVVAIPENDEHYEMSDYSEIKIIEYYTKQEKITSAELNKENKILTIYTDLLFNASKFALSFNYGVMSGVIEHQLIVDDLTKEEVIKNGQSALKFTVNISEFLKEDIVNISVIVLGDGKYSTNSDSYTVQ